jgi:hypothetical protein
MIDGDVSASLNNKFVAMSEKIWIYDYFSFRSYRGQIW